VTYAFFERPPPAEGIWFCRRCMMDRAFVTTVALEGRDAPDAPLFCSECEWEIEPEVDIVQRYPEPPIETRGRLSPEFRAAGKERWRKYLLSLAAPRSRTEPEAMPHDSAAFALQLAQLQGERGRRL
jgi:hypothetical protein